MPKTPTIIITLFLHLQTPKILTNLTQRILPTSKQSSNALTNIYHNILNNYQYSHDWRSQDSYQKIITTIKTQKKNSPINKILQYFNNIFKKDITNRCKISIFKSMENPKNSSFFEFKADLLELCDAWGVYIRENVNLSLDFYDPNFAIFFFEVHLKQKLDQMDSEDFTGFGKLKSCWRFFVWVVKDDIEVVRKGKDLKNREVLNYGSIFKGYAVFWNYFMKNLFDHDMNPFNFGK